MFFSDKIALSNLKVENGELKREVDRLKNDIKQYDKLIADINNERTESEFEIDFKTMRVFSIERGVSQNLPATVFGYYVAEPVVSSDGEMIVMRDKVNEWTFYCSPKRHNEIVEKFRAYNASK